MEQVDPNKFIAEIVTTHIDRLYESTKKFISNANTALKVKLDRTFTEYLIGIERKYSSTKTIIYRDTPQSIYRFYEPIDLSNDKMNLTSPIITDLLKLKKPIIITGTGGSGKSTFLKYLLLNSITINKNIPIFVELRDVEKVELTLINYINRSLQLNKVDLPAEYLDQVFTGGDFIFLLDGFDELSPTFSQKIGDEIDNLSQLYPKCHFIVTSRPGQEFISWTNFIELRAKPLSLTKAVSLVNRLNYDVETKSNFIRDLQKTLYNSHKSFFENPLLLSIMLLTYRESASIPAELHNFYSLAFEALYYRHDASKSFKRPTLTTVPVNQGKNILASFSLITYLKNQTAFNSHELKEYLSKALRLVDCECDIHDLIIDFQRAYCMLLQDGTTYQYTHRSFQEYFTACYLVSANEKHQIQLIEEFSKKADKDITLLLAYGMNPKMIEEKLFIPFLKEFKEKIGYKNKITKTVFKKFAANYFDQVRFLDNIAGLSVQGSESASKVRDLSVTRLIIQIYRIDTTSKSSKANPLKTDNTNPLRRRFIPIHEAFKNNDLVDWLLTYSVERRVLEELMSLEKKLHEKNEKKSELLELLLETKAI